MTVTSLWNSRLYIEGASFSVLASESLLHCFNVNAVTPFVNGTILESKERY